MPDLFGEERADEAAGVEIPPAPGPTDEEKIAQAAIEAAALHRAAHCAFVLRASFETPPASYKYVSIRA